MEIVFLFPIGEPVCYVPGRFIQFDWRFMFPTSPPPAPKINRVVPEPYCQNHGKMNVTSTRRRKGVRYFKCPLCSETAKEVIASVERVIE